MLFEDRQWKEMRDCLNAIDAGEGSVDVEQKAA